MSDKELPPSHNSISALLLSGLSHAKGHRDAVQPGTYSVDEYLRVRGTIKIGPDTETRQVNKIDPWTILSVALSKVNDETRKAIIKEAQAILDAKDGNQDNELKELKKETEEAVAALKEATKKPRRGSVTIVSQEIEVVTVDRIREKGVEVGDLAPQKSA